MDIQQVGIHKSVERTFPPGQLQAHLAEAVPSVDFEVISDEDLAGCDAIVTHKYSDIFLDADLDWIQTIQSGVDRFPFDKLKEHGIVLTNSKGIHGPGVGESVTGYMLNFARLLHRYRWSQRERKWDRPEWNEPTTLIGETVCIVGLGVLGKAVATRADSLGMQVIGVKRTPEPVDHVEQVYPAEKLNEAIADARFVVLAVPLTDATEGLIGSSELEVMQKGAYLINVARGGVIEDSVLVPALRSDEIAGAALDVFHEEPLPADSPLWTMENVIITPHAVSLTKDYYRNVGKLVVENLTRSPDEPFRNRIV